MSSVLTQLHTLAVGKGEMGFMEPVIQVFKNIGLLGMRSEEEGGATLVWLATSEDVKDQSGLFYKGLLWHSVSISYC